MQFPTVEIRFIVTTLLYSTFANDLKRKYFFLKNVHSYRVCSFNMCGFDSDFFPECKSKSISGGFIHQAGIFGVKCFSIFCGLIYELEFNDASTLLGH